MPKKQSKPALAPPQAAKGKTLQEKAAKAIQIRESTSKAREGKSLTFPTRLLRD